MHLVTHNPYRIIGVLANATEKEILKQKNKSIAYLKANKEITSDLDFSNLDVIERSTETVTKAFSQIELSEDKIFYALFWFLNEQPIDNIAIENLKVGNFDKANDIWRKITLDKEITEKNIVSFSNLSTLLFITGSNKDAMLLKIRVLESPFFQRFIEICLGSELNISISKITEKFLNAYFTSNEQQEQSEVRKYLLSNLSKDSYARRYLIEISSLDDIHRLEQLCDSIEELHNDNNLLSMDDIRKFTQESKAILSKLSGLLGKNELQIRMLSNKFAEVLRASVNIYHNQNNSDELTKQDLENCKTFMAVAKSYATDNQTVHIIEDELASYDEEIENFEMRKSIITIAELAEKIKDFNDSRQTSISALAFARDCRNNYLLGIKKQVGESNELYLKMSSAIVNICLSVSIDEVNDAQSKLSKGVSIKKLNGLINNGLKLLNYLSCFNMDDETHERLNNNLNAINNLHRDVSNILENNRSSETSRTSSNNSDSEGCAGVLGWVILAIIIFAIIGSR